MKDVGSASLKIFYCQSPPTCSIGKTKETIHCSRESEEGLGNGLLSLVPLKHLRLILNLALKLLPCFLNLATPVSLGQQALCVLNVKYKRQLHVPRSVHCTLAGNSCSLPVPWSLKSLQSRRSRLVLNWRSIFSESTDFVRTEISVRENGTISTITKYEVV